jgi:ubiquinol-cytochrome c reductase cytochrome c1 subunit
MKNFLLFALLILVPVLGHTKETLCGAEDSPNPECLVAPINPQDKVSLQNGAKLFLSYCAGCHSMKYLRYQRMADDLDIDPKLVQKYMMFTTDKIGDAIDSKVDKKDQAKWFGNAPPDLTLEARLRSPDWIYTYLQAFYPDDKRPWGVNNHVFKDVAMPNVLAPLEAELGPDDYKQAVGDIVNFMNYASEPNRAEREHLGVYVLAFLLLFLFPAVYFLNKEYWKDIT